MISYDDRSIPGARDFLALVESAGWQGFAEKGLLKIEEALSNSWYLVCARDGDRLVGIGRVVSDGVLQALICDLIVLPEYQGRGIGTEILTRLLRKCADHDILMVTLFAAKDKGGFYKPFGFEERPQDAPGMRWVNRDIVRSRLLVPRAGHRDGTPNGRRSARS